MNWCNYVILILAVRFFRHTVYSARSGLQVSWNIGNFHRRVYNTARRNFIFTEDYRIRKWKKVICARLAQYLPMVHHRLTWLDPCSDWHQNARRSDLCRCADVQPNPFSSFSAGGSRTDGQTDRQTDSKLNILHTNELHNAIPIKNNNVHSVWHVLRM